MRVIEPFRYLDKTVFEDERKKIFESQWLFACVTDELKKPKDYLVIEMMGKSVIIFNTGKIIRAFQNVCVHRFNRIFTNDSGNGPLLCKYHSWAYDDNGKLIGKDKLKITPEPDEKNICLKQYPVKVIGRFVFMHFAETPEITLEDQLGELVDDLQLMSEVLGEKINDQFVPHAVNWKFIVENVIEFNHCKSIHQETLVKSGFCTVSPERVRIKNNSYAVNPCIEDAASKKRHAIMNKYLKRDIVNTDFKHTLMFPNFTLAVFEGIIVTIGQILPVSPGLTNYKLSYYFTTLKEDSEVGRNILDDLRISAPDYNNKLFTEDKTVLEQLQKGVAETGHPGFVYESEERILWFFDSYNTLMNKA